MAKAHKCDRCGKYYDDNQFEYARNGKHLFNCSKAMIRGLDRTGLEEFIDFELCDDCLNETVKFLENKED